MTVSLLHHQWLVQQAHLLCYQGTLSCPTWTTSCYNYIILWYDSHTHTYIHICIYFLPPLAVFRIVQLVQWLGYTWLRDQSLIPGNGKIPQYPDWLWGTPSLIPEAQGTESCSWSHISINGEVKNLWRYTSSPPYASWVQCLAQNSFNFTFPFTLLAETVSTTTGQFHVAKENYTWQLICSQLTHSFGLLSCRLMTLPFHLMCVCDCYQLCSHVTDLHKIWMNIMLLKPIPTSIF